jgi:protein SCO1/2
MEKIESESAMRLWVLTALIWSGTAASAGVVKSLPLFDSKDLTPYWSTDNGAVSRKPVVLSAFHVMDQNENSVTQENLKKNISLVNFFFASCPGICPTMMNTLKSAQKNFGDAYIYSFSVTPKEDPPKRLREYVKKRGLSIKNWSLLTGDEKEIFRVGKSDLKADGAIGEQKKENSFIHTTNVYLIDRDLRLRGIYDTADSNAMNLLAQDIARLSKE